MPLVNLKSNLSQIKETTPTPLKVGNKLISTNKYVRTIVDSEKTPSPIEIFHTDTTSRTGRFPLAEYYAQAKGKGRLGYRNNDVTGFDQPFVIRDIGEKWGVDRIELGDTKFANTVEGILNFSLGFLNSAGESIYGRSPNEYIGSGLGSLLRMGKFLGTPQGAAFLLKQKVLMGRNKQKWRTDVKYGLAGAPDLESATAANLSKAFENPRAYNIFSLGSLPGVTKISINKLDPNLIITPYIDTISSMLSPYAIAAVSNIGRAIEKRFKQAFGNPSINKVIGNLKTKFPGITKSVDDLKDKARTVDEARKAFDEVGSDFKAAVSKRVGLKINPNVKALASVGVDRVNLIPYGNREEAKHLGKTEEELDFVPFRFEDMSGNLIVFRALLSAITDTFTPNYAEQKYIGRPDKVYVYTGTDRAISFTFNIYPKSDQELSVLWDKMNYLAGLTYPTWDDTGMGMIAPFCKLTIGDMYRNTPGYLSGLTYTVQDTGTWETMLAKLPKFIQAQCTFVYIGDRLPSSKQKFYDPVWIPEVNYSTESPDLLMGALGASQQALGVLGLDNSANKVGEWKDTLKSLPIG
jgi:hypothetical protein